MRDAPHPHPRDGDDITPTDSLVTLVPFGVLVMRGPLVQVSLLGFEQNRFFTELAVPVRFGEDSGGRFVSGGFAIALGVVFM